VRCSGEEDGTVDECPHPFLPFFSAELRWPKCEMAVPLQCHIWASGGIDMAKHASVCSSRGVRAWGASRSYSVLLLGLVLPLVRVKQAALQKRKVWSQGATRELAHT